MSMITIRTTICSAYMSFSRYERYEWTLLFLDRNFCICRKRHHFWISYNSWPKYAAARTIPMLFTLEIWYVHFRFSLFEKLGITSSLSLRNCAWLIFLFSCISNMAAHPNDVQIIINHDLIHPSDFDLSEIHGWKLYGVAITGRLCQSGE